MADVDPNLATVALRLGPFRDEVVFLGGAVVGLLITDPAAPEIRVTEDVDVIVEVASKSKFIIFEQELQRLGFRSDSEPDAPRCRYVIDGVKVDVMPTDADILGFANEWASESFRSAESFEVRAGLTIRHVNAPFFLATKLEAFLGRGGGDLIASHDIEDIIAVIDGRPAIVDDVIATYNAPLKKFLRSEVVRWGTRLSDVVQAHLPPDSASQRRAPIVLERLRALAGLKVTSGSN